LPQYNRFVQRKLAAAAEKTDAPPGGGVLPLSPPSSSLTFTYLPHEPVGFIGNNLAIPTSDV
jgi:hypothetical protein